WSMAVGLFRMAFLVMLERTLTQFMKGVFQVSILNDPVLNKAIKILGLLLVFASLMPPQLSGWLALLLAVLLAGRFIYWKPQLAMQRRCPAAWPFRAARRHPHRRRPTAR